MLVLLPFLVVLFALLLIIIVIHLLANRGNYIQRNRGDVGDVGHPCTSSNAFLRLAKEIRQHNLRFTMTLMPSVFERIGGLALEKRKRHNGLWLRYKWGTLHYSVKSRRATFYVEDLEAFRDFVIETGLEVPRNVKAEFAIPVLDMWPLGLEDAKVLVRGADGQMSLVYFDRSQGYTEMELRGDFEQSLRLAKLIVYPSLETHRILYEIRDNVKALVQAGGLPVLNAIKDLQVLNANIVKMQQRVLELLEKTVKQQNNSQQARTLRTRSKRRVTFDDLPASIKEKIEVLIERGVAYCSQYRVYPTRLFMQKIRNGQLPQILAAAPDELLPLIKLLAKRPNGISFSELYELGDEIE